MITESECPAYDEAEPRAPYPLHVLSQPPASVLEVGAGAGTGSLQLVEAFPAATVVCLEPGDAPRAALAWRLRPHLGERLSVLPLAVEDAGFLPGVDLVVAHHVVCQVAAERRPQFWAAVAARLTPGGTVLVDDHVGPTSTSAVERKLSSTGRAGDYTVRRWFSARALGAREREVTVEHEVLTAGGDVVHHDVQVSVQQVVTRDEALAEIRAAGLEVEVPTEEWLSLAVAR